MIYEEVLLIGGPSDGKRISVIAGVSEIRVPALETEPNSLGLEIHPYKRHPVHSAQGFLGAVYVAGGVDPMVALIDGYRKP